MQNWVNKYVGIPYVFGGFDHKGCDCYGLVVLINKEILNRNLPTYSNEVKSVEDTQTIDEIFLAEKSKWKRVSKPAVGDIVYFMIAGHPMHVGVCIGGGLFIHNYKDGGSSCIGELSNSRWKKRFLGFWHYE